MKRTPRMQKAILQSAILNTLIILVLLGIFFIIILPQVLYFQDKKKELTELYNYFSSLQKVGISFVDFKANFRSLDGKDAYVETILKNIDNSFYQKNLQNTKDVDFNTFIKTLQETVEDEKKSDFYTNRLKAIQEILPVYGSLDSEGLKERDFINKTERIFRAFNLKAKGEIGIGDIKPYNQKKNSDTQKGHSSLEESIFYIPLSFDLVGKKKDVFDFLHYFEKVGSIGISENVLSVYNDEKIRNPFSIRNLTGEGNIYEDQVAEISSLEANKYPDSATFSGNGEEKTLLEIVSLNQAKERYEVSVTVNFYVSGLPEYSMREYMSSVIVNYQRLKKESQTTLQRAKKNSKSLNTGTQIQALNVLVSLNTLFSTLDESFVEFQKEMRKTSDVRKTFKDAQVLDGQLTLMEGKLKLAIEDLK